jgi:E3 ubiquitin-protein ligase EDD1
MWTSDEIEYWEGIRFTHIVAMHSELVGLSTQGHLHQWRWADSQPYRNIEVR